MQDSSDPGGLPVRAALGPVADEAFDRIAALVRTVLGVPVALVSLVDRDGQVFPGQSGLPQPWADSRCTPLTHSFCQYVVRSGEPLVVPDARLDPRLRTNLAIQDIGVVAYAGIPLVDLDGAVVGSLCAIDTEPRDWTPSEIELLDDLVSTCSAELKLRAAALAATESNSRMSVLLELSETLSDTITPTDVAQAVGKLAIGRLGGSFGGIALLDVKAHRLTYLDLDLLPAVVQQQYRSYSLSDEMPACAAARTGRALYFADLDHVADEYPDAARAMRTAQAYAAAYLPLPVGDAILGTVVILWSQARTFTDSDRALLAALSRYTAQALQRAVLLADRREVAETLQNAMLPVLPRFEGAELAACYRPAHTGNAVGGDWYDAFGLPDGTLAVSIGDVQGHDTAAAAAMGRLRAVLRGLAITTSGEPNDILSALDLVLANEPHPDLATSIVAAVRWEDSGTMLSWSNAGHPSPLLLAPEQPPAYLQTTPQLLLGTRFAPASRTTEYTALPPGSTLLLFSDGLVERRLTDMNDSLADLADSAARHRHRPVAEMIDAIIEDMLVEPQEDDLVLFGIRILR